MANNQTPESLARVQYNGYTFDELCDIMNLNEVQRKYMFEFVAAATRDAQKALLVRLKRKTVKVNYGRFVSTSAIDAELAALERQADGEEGDNV